MGREGGGESRFYNYINEYYNKRASEGRKRERTGGRRRSERGVARGREIEGTRGRNGEGEGGREGKNGREREKKGGSRDGSLQGECSVGILRGSGVPRTDVSG